MKRLKQAISGQLGRQFSILIILFSSCFTLLSTSVQLAFDYKADINRIEQQFTNIQNAYVNSISLSVWSLDDSQVTTQMRGLEQLPDIEHVAIFVNNKISWQAGRKISSATQTRIYPLRHSEFEEETLGQLIVTASIDNVYDRLINKAGVILVSNGVKTFLVSGFIMFLIWWKVTRHLKTVSSYVTELDLDIPSAPLKLLKKRDEDKADEFDVVTDAINSMQQGLSQSYQELNAAQTNLKHLLKERNQLLASEREHKSQLEVKVQERTKELARSTEALERSETQLLNILETSPIAVSVCRATDHSLLFSNQTCASMLGYSLDDWLSSNPVDAWQDPNNWDRFVRNFSQFGLVSTEETLLKRRDGSEFWALVTWENINFEQQNNILFWIVDISDQKKTEQALVVAKDHAEAAAQAKADFLATMSHEIRTPMNAVVGFSHLALQTELTHQQQDYLSKIQLSAHNLLRVINDILDFSKIEAGKLQIEHTAFCLDDVLEHLCDLLRLKAEEKGLDILLFHRWDLTRNLVGDSLRLGQILTNLASNAIKFTERGQVSITLEELKRDQNQVTLSFTVTDTGIGISQEEMDKLFQPFTQADTSTTRQFGGTGLGLVISKQLVEMMGGEISCTSHPGQGSSFTFNCQFEIDTQQQQSVRTNDIKGRRVLIVDDNQASRDILLSLTRNFGMDAHTVNSGDAAIIELQRNLASTEPAYDLLLLDWLMPGLNGLECAQKIKTLSMEKPLPAIVMVTAHNREDVVHNIESHQLDGFLLKPVSPSLLLTAINSALNAIDIEEAPSKPTSATINSKGCLRGVHILLVEDNLINQQVAQEILNGFGATVTTANNGQQAVNQVLYNRYDLVLMDIQMPGMDGLEATRQIRLMPGYHKLPIIAMTANALPDDRERSFAAGMDAHINKPIQPDILLKTLLHWVKPDNVELTDDLNQQTSAKTPDIEGMNCSNAMQRLNGNLALYNRLMTDFNSQHHNTAATLTRHIDKQNYADAARLLHGLAGVAGNLGADQLHDKARELELLLQQRNLTTIKESQQNCIDTLQQLLAAISLYLEQTDELTQSVSKVKSPPLNQSCLELREALQEGDSRSGDFLRSIESNLGSQFFDQQKKLRQLIEDYDFDEALEVLDTLESEIAQS